MKTLQIRAILAGAGLASITVGYTPVMAEIAAPAPNGEDERSRVAMTVHEWGTFTVLQGSDGGPVEWYQAPKDIVDLPEFVRQSGALSKAGIISGLDLVRMETPCSISTRRVTRPSTSP